MDANNWQNVLFDLPITSWGDLENLQVSVLGYSGDGTLVQSVYLDGMDVAVEYDDMSAMQTSLIQPTVPAEVQPVQAPVVQAPAPMTFDARAKQTCDIEPYSKTVAIGSSVQFGVTLMPSVKPAPLFEIQIGQLPAGVTGSVVPSAQGALHPDLSLSASTDAAAGSYNVIVLYQEKQPDGTYLPNYCQFNLVVE